MEYVISSEESSDADIKNLRHQLTEYGLNEDNLSKEEMTDLLKVLQFSKTTAKDEERQKKEENSCTSPKVKMKRKYLNVRDRRLPWSLFPNTTAASEKAKLLAVYFKILSINNYRQARQSVNFGLWPPPIQILEETTRVQPQRSTRSGRVVPVYAGFDDDSSDADFIATKTKKRKVSTSEHNEASNNNRGLSLKRKLPKEENCKSVKEPKNNTNKNDVSQKSKADSYLLIED